jgi:hypothetical protein
MCVHKLTDHQFVIRLSSQVVERESLDWEVRGSNPSRDTITMGLLLGQHYEFPPVWDNKGKIIIID